MIRRSKLANWEMAHPDSRIPEQINSAGATIFVAGSAGTFWARNWAYFARKPIFGIPCFGGSGEKIYDQELQSLQVKLLAQAEQYEALNQLSTDIELYAHGVITLVEHWVKLRNVFLII